MSPDGASERKQGRQCVRVYALLYDCKKNKKKTASTWLMNIQQEVTIIALGEWGPWPYTGCSRSETTQGWLSFRDHINKLISQDIQHLQGGIDRLRLEKKKNEKEKKEKKR